MSFREYGIEAARKILGDLVREVEATGQPITLTRGNSKTPVAQISPLKEHPMTVTINTVAPAELHRQYPGQNEPQPAYVEVDLEGQMVLATYNAEIGNTRPEAVLHGIERRYDIPALTSTAANELLEKIAPFAERMVSDWEKTWDGNNHVAVLGDDAEAAETEIDAMCADMWEDSEKVTVWDTDGAIAGDEAETYGITADTTDERLEEIEEEILTSLKEVSASNEVVLEGVAEHLESLRDDAPKETLIWSLVRGESPDSRAVEPGPYGITVPDSVLDWAKQHGLWENGTGLYFLVTTEEEAGEVQGEVAYTDVEAPLPEAEKVRQALRDAAAEDDE